jgi:hypothetical protein
VGIGAALVVSSVTAGISVVDWSSVVVVSVLIAASASVVTSVVVVSGSLAIVSGSLAVVVSTEDISILLVVSDVVSSVLRVVVSTLGMVDEPVRSVDMLASEVESSFSVDDGASLVLESSDVERIMEDCEVAVSAAGIVVTKELVLADTSVPPEEAITVVPDSDV